MKVTGTIKCKPDRNDGLLYRWLGGNIISVTHEFLNSSINTHVDGNVLTIGPYTLKIVEQDDTRILAMCNTESSPIWHERLAHYSRVIDRVKLLVPASEEVRGNFGYSGIMVIIHNGKGGIKPNQHWLNKLTFCVDNWGKVSLHKQVARTDPNYIDQDYVNKLAVIVEESWQDTLFEEVQNADNS